MRCIILVVPILLGLASVAPAQSILEALAGLKFCRTLKDDAQRLKCFDGIAVDNPNLPSSPTKPEVEGAWQIEEGKSPLDDSPQVTGTLSGTKSDATLIVRCKEKKTEVIFFKTFSFLGSTNSIRVLVRIGDGKLIETRWSPSTTGRGAFAPSPVQFVRALPDDGKLFIRAIGYSGASEDGEFSLGKVSEIREKVAQACNWKDHQ